MPSPWPDLTDRANADGEFRQAARLWTGSLRFDAGDESTRLELRDGVVVSCAPCAKGTDADARVSGPADEWERLLSTEPPPTHQDLFGSLTLARFELDGDAQSFNAYYPAVRRLVELARESR